jgi:hypothetical protein
MNIIYIGRKFFFESSGRLSFFYTEEGHRTDIHFIETELIKGNSVNIRPANTHELSYYQKRLDLILEKDNAIN